MTNELTSCCHTPYFADGVCMTCGNKCTPFTHDMGALVNERIDYYPDPIHEPIKPLPEYIEPVKTIRFKGNERFELSEDLNFQQNLES